jgi:hypothetical protein
MQLHQGHPVRKYDSVFTPRARWLSRLFLASVLLGGFEVATFGQTNFATLTSDGAWTWYNDDRALFHNGKLYFGFVRASDGKSTVSSFDLTTGRTTNLWNSGFTQLDDHNNPALLVKQDGRLLSAYSRHLSDQYFSYRTSNSSDPATPPAGMPSRIFPTRALR